MIGCLMGLQPESTDGILIYTVTYFFVQANTIIYLFNLNDLINLKPVL